jgi:nucleoside-diphosphate-sugar epimerase
MTGAILVFGASRETGLEVTKLLVARGEDVAAFARPTSDLTELKAAKPQQIIYGDVLDPVCVGKAFAAGRFRAVVCTIGAHRGQVPRPDFEGVKVIVDSIRKLDRDVPRMILVTVIGAGDSRDAVAPKVLEVLGEVIRLKTLAENYLMESSLRWVILRPGGMTSDPPTGTGIRTGDRQAMGVITRADLARLVVECIDDETTDGHVFHTVDPQIKWQPPLQRGDDFEKRHRG